MKMPIRWKLMISYLAIIVVVLAIGMAYLQVGFSAQLQDQLETRLTREAHLARQYLRFAEVRREGDLEKLVDDLAGQIGQSLSLRITVIARDGRVLGDSELSLDALKLTENHATRPEVVDAQRKKIGKSVRTSKTVGREFLYLALPILNGPVQGGVIRLAIDISEVEENVGKIRRLLLFAGGLALLLATGVSFGVGRVAHGAILHLNQGIGAISRGDYAHRIESSRLDELGDLSRALDRLSEDVETRLDELRRERDRFGTILQEMSEGVMVTDSSGSIVLVNPAFRRFFPTLPVIREDYPTPMEALRAPQIQDNIRRVLGVPNETMESEVEVAGPPPRTLSLHAAKFGVSNGEQLVVVFHDVTEIKRLEGIRQEFTANVSHELKTPLTVIRGSADTLQDSAHSDPDAVRRFASTIVRHCHRLEALIEDLLELGRIESETAHVQLRATSLRDAADSAIRVLEPLLQRLRVRVKIDIPDEADTALSDSSALERVFINLVENAANYSPEGSEISISARLDGENSVEVSIADRGEGIPPEHLPRIFERFYRVDPSRSRERGGTGLGLAIVKHLVQGMEGYVDVESSPGVGSTFRIYLCRAE